MKNRSVPAEVMLTHAVYRDAAAAVIWLGRVFGFKEHFRYGEGAGMGAQLRLGDACVMVRGLRGDEKTPRELGFGTQSVTVFVQDVEGMFARAKAEGADIVEEPHETVYGEMQFAARDLDGHVWIFSWHARDVAPEEWGATVAG